MPEDATVQMGLDMIEDWLRDQFPDAYIEPLVQKSDVPRYRWIRMGISTHPSQV